MCIRSQLCQIDGCRGNHHCLLHEVLPVTETTSPAAQEGVASPDGECSPTPPALTIHNPRTSEAYYLHTIPVWVKVKGKKIKVNAILDDASNESFLNEEVAGALKTVLPNSKSPCVKQLCGDLSSYAIDNHD